MNSFDLAWNLADIFMGFMALVNLIALLFLGKWALAALDDYTRQRKEASIRCSWPIAFPVCRRPNAGTCPRCTTTASRPVKEYLDDASDPEYVG